MAYWLDREGSAARESMKPSGKKANEHKESLKENEKRQPVSPCYRCPWVCSVGRFSNPGKENRRNILLFNKLWISQSRKSDCHNPSSQKVLFPKAPSAFGEDRSWGEKVLLEGDRWGILCEKIRRNRGQKRVLFWSCDCLTSMRKRGLFHGVNVVYFLIIYVY